VLIIICLTKQILHVTCQCGYGVVTWCCADPVSGYQMLSPYFYVSQVSRQTYIETMQPRLFEEWIEKGHEQDTNLCGAYARPTNEQSLVRGRGGFLQWRSKPSFATEARETQGAASDSRGLNGTASPAPDTLSKLGTQPKLVLS